VPQHAEAITKAQQADVTWPSMWVGDG